MYTLVDDPMGRACGQILRAVAAGPAAGTTSTAVLEEVWHLELSDASGRSRGLTERCLAAITPLIAVDEEVFRLALGLPASRLGANDRIHAATCLVHGIDTIVTADRDFGEIAELRRLDPLDDTAIAGLLQG
jgi:predicted nucleic acid-binding protein